MSANKLTTPRQMMNRMAAARVGEEPESGTDEAGGVKIEGCVSNPVIF